MEAALNTPHSNSVSSNLTGSGALSLSHTRLPHACTHSHAHAHVHSLHPISVQSFSYFNLSMCLSMCTHIDIEPFFYLIFTYRFIELCWKPWDVLGKVEFVGAAVSAEVCLHHPVNLHPQLSQIVLRRQWHRTLKELGQQVHNLQTNCKE